jgi:hypothetical protein
MVAADRFPRLVVVGLILSLAGCAGSPDIRDPGPDFGFIPNAIGIVDPGRVYVENAVELEHDGDANAARVPVLVRVGVADDWEVRGLAWALQTEEDDDGDRETGAGPVQLGFKHRLSRGGGQPLEPAYGFEFELLLPASIGDFDDGKVEPAAFVNVDHTFSPEGVFTWNVFLKLFS